MSALQAHRTALAALLASVPDAGVVHSFEPYAKTQSEFAAAYVWTTFTLNAHTWRITGYMALDDGGATELVFDELVEAIRLAYRLDPTLGGAAQLSPADGAGIDVTDSKPVVFCGVLCHSATLQLTTHAYLDSGE